MCCRGVVCVAPVSSGQGCLVSARPGPRRVLWNELDGNGNGSVSLMEIDEATGKMVENLFVAANHRRARSADRA